VRNSALCATLLLAPALALAAESGRNVRLAEQFRRADADGDGMLSRVEAERGAPLLAKRFDIIDVNRDGQISPEEIRSLRRPARNGRGAKGGSRFEHYFARADGDSDGVLSRAEAEQGLPRVAKKFDRIDRDGDGRLTREELQAWLAARRAARPGK
jgi:Ca2+-binding EF-hand superfamily protein